MLVPVLKNVGRCRWLKTAVLLVFFLWLVHVVSDAHFTISHVLFSFESPGRHIITCKNLFGYYTSEKL